jgi:hypothetical protein
MEQVLECKKKPDSGLPIIGSIFEIPGCTALNDPWPDIAAWTM